MTLAHLSRRITRWAYSIPMVQRPSVVLRPHFQTWISLKPVGQSWSNFMCSITGVGGGCIRFWDRLDQNSGFHSNRKPPLTYNGENDVSTFSRLFLIRSFLYLRTRKKISDEFEFRPDRTTDYGVSCLERLKMSHRLIIGKCCFHASSFIFNRIIIKVAGNQDRRKSSDDFVFGPDQTTHFAVTCPWMTIILHFRTWIYLRPVGQSWSNIMCSITGGGGGGGLGVEKGCIMFWGRFNGNRKPPWPIMGKTMSPPFLGCFWSDHFYTWR